MPVTFGIDVKGSLAIVILAKKRGSIPRRAELLLMGTLLVEIIEF